MRFFLVLAGAPLLLGFVPGTAATIPTISATGSKFFDSNGNQFFIKGVAYQPVTTDTLSDPLTNTVQCTLDAAAMRDLGVNTVRVYYVNSTEDHSGCMSAFEAAGIYVLVNLDSPTSGIGRISPAWTTSQLNNFSAVMDSFASYDNTLGFFVGNEVINDMTNSDVAPYIKAAAVDLKNYRNSKGYREIPVGYSGAHVDGLIPYLQNYLACGSDTVDFFGQNQYSWCDPSSFFISGYNTLYANASKYSVPIFFSETGCNLNPPRKFDDQAAIFGPEMNDEWSGAVIYEWSADLTGYGLVSYDSSAMTSTRSPDFTNLKNQWATLTPTGTPIVSYDIATITPPACPTYTSGGWLVSGDVKLSTLLEAVSVTSSRSVSRSTTGPTQGAPTSPSGSKAPPLVSNTSTPDASANAGMSAGVKAAIALGVIVIFVVILLAAFLLWRRRRNIPPKEPLDLSAEGLEVGMAPPKQEHDSPSISTQEAHTGSHTHASELGSPTIISAELENSTPSQLHPDSSIPTTAELPAIPATQKVGSASPTKTFASSIPSHAVHSSTASSSWANAPWHPETSPIDAEREAKAQEVPLLTTNEEEDELSQIEAEERRIDAQIAESERIRALKAEKAALQVKKAEVLAKRESSAEN